MVCRSALSQTVLIGVPKRHRGEFLIHFDFDHRDIGEGVCSDDFGLEVSPIRKIDAEVVCTFDNMIVGQNVPIGRDYETTASGYSVPLLRLLRFFVGCEVRLIPAVQSKSYCKINIFR